MITNGLEMWAKVFIVLVCNSDLVPHEALVLCHRKPRYVENMDEMRDSVFPQEVFVHDGRKGPEV
jgi:hypothetical protein